ncbi:MAG TPA: Ku protein [Bryobacteraceae bacterium]|jgi:DNA end-binding protein Ku|nr:Ku protein [Bryobacteraceae bacterium]
MATTVWKGSITFGLVSIPIRLYAAARSRGIALHQLHDKCHTRLKQPLFCPTCNRFVERGEVVKGYEYEKGQYVLIDPEEVKKITPASGQTMDILAFVDEAQVDPLYFDSSYLAVPEAQGAKAYRLLIKALEETNRMGVAKVTMHQREYTVFLRPRKHGLTLHTMYYTNEIATVPEYGKQDDSKLNPQELKLAEQLVQSLDADFNPRQYRDEFQERLNQLIEAKMKGRSIAAAPEAPRAPVIDIMEALKKSLAATSKKQEEPRPEAQPARAVARRQRRKAG